LPFSSFRSFFPGVLLCLLRLLFLITTRRGFALSAASIAAATAATLVTMLPPIAQTAERATH